MLFDSDGGLTDSRGSCGLRCPLAPDFAQGTEASEKCRAAHLHAFAQSERFGGKYIYFCPGSLIFAASPLQYNPEGAVFPAAERPARSRTRAARQALPPEIEKQYITAGPIIAQDIDDFLAASQPAGAEVRQYLEGLCGSAPERITDIQDLLFMLARFLDGQGGVAAAEAEGRAAAADRRVYLPGQDAADLRRAVSGQLSVR